MHRATILVVLAAAAGGLAAAQEAGSGRLTVSFTDPSRPGTVRCHIVQGDIVVAAYEGKDVIVETGRRRQKGGSGLTIRRSGEREPPQPPAPPAGPPLPLAIGRPGMTVEEQNNAVTVSMDMAGRNSNLRIQVPASTSLDLRTVNGRLLVEGVAGEIQAQAINGSVQLIDIMGPVVAHSVNGSLKAVFARVPHDKPMSFSSLNGSIDATFPADLKANLSIRSGHGEVYSDFDITLKSDSKAVVEDKRAEGGKYRARLDSSVNGVINSGGPELRFKAFNGKIYLRKK
ncbi:MAG: hypothetical protein ACKV22_35445 [Bryobacteraceae bacterium]